MSSNSSFILLTACYARIATSSCTVTLSHERLYSLGGEFARIVHIYKNASTTADVKQALTDETSNMHHFVWFLSTDPSDFAEFNSRPASEIKCGRLAGIAAVAYAYECPGIVNWAVPSVLKELEGFRAFCPSVETLLALHRATGKTNWVSPEVCADRRQRVQEIWCDALRAPSSDLVEMLQAAQKAADNFVAAHAYFYILDRGVPFIFSEHRLTSADCRRLVCGALELSRRGIELDVYPRILKFDIPSATDLTIGLASTNGHSGVSFDKGFNTFGMRNFSTSRQGRIKCGESPAWKFRANVDSQIATMRDTLVKAFFESPWPLD